MPKLTFHFFLLPLLPNKDPLFLRKYKTHDTVLTFVKYLDLPGVIF